MCVNLTINECTLQSYMSVAGYVARVTCVEFSQCYYDINICLWTNGSQLTQSAAQTACVQRDNSSFLPRVTDSNIRGKLAEFRSAASNILGGDDFWLDVTTVGISSAHWIDGSPLTGRFVSVKLCVKNVQQTVCVVSVVHRSSSLHGPWESWQMWCISTLI